MKLFKRESISKISLIKLVVFSACSMLVQVNAQTTFDWNAGATSGLWSVAGNWGGTAPGGSEILQFGNNVQTVMTNDLAIANRFKITFQAGATASRTIAGAVANTFYEFGATWPRIQNDATNVLHSIGFPINASTNAGFNLELVANAGPLDFTNTINNNSRTIQIYGNNTAVDGSNRYIRLSSVVSNAGVLNISQHGVVRINAAQTYTGQTQIDNGELWMESAGSIAAGSAIFVGNGGQLTNVTKFWISNAAGGTTVSNALTINNGNANTRYLGGLNSSGMHTFSGNITNNSNTGGLNLSALTAGGTTVFSGVISGNSALTTEGAGTVILSGAGANTYTGVTTANGTLLVLNKTAGIAAIPTATTIASGATIRTDAANQWGVGTPPLVTINGNGILNLNNNNQKIALASASSTASVTLGSATLNIDNTGTDTYAGTISGTGGVTKTNTGAQILSGTGNSYTGTTTITGGILRLGTAGVIPDASNIIMNGGTLSSGAAAGFSETMGTLTLNANSTLALGTGNHTLTFSNSSGLSWTGNQLIITGWTGTYNGASSGTAGKIFVGNSASGLTSLQLTKIQFLNAGNYYPATQLSTGEVVPTGAIGLYWGGTAAQSWTSSTWGTINGGPYSTAWTDTRAAIFNVPNSTMTGATANFASITANENVTISSIGGTLGFMNVIAPIYVESSKLFDFSTNTFSTSATFGIIKNGAGAIALVGNTYGGGFTLNDGLVIVRGVNALGSGGLLSINGGTIGANANRDLSGKFSSISIGGDFTLGSSTSPAVGSSNLTFSNNIALGNSVTRTITLGGTGIYVCDGVISGTSSNLTITASAAGVLSFGGISTYGGNTTINGGTLRLTTGADRLPTTTGLILGNISGAILDLYGQNQSAVSLSGGGTSGGNIALGAGTLTVNQSSNTTYSGLISGTGAIIKTGTGTLTIGHAANTYTGTTTISAGELRFNPSTTTGTFASQIILNGGKLSTTNISAATTFTSSSTLNLNASSTLDLGSNVHSLSFANSSGVGWSGVSLTINGWTGSAGSSGTSGKIFFGSDATGLTSAQLAKISFTGFTGTATILATGEIVPATTVNYTWNGSSSSGWTTNTNWTPNGIPGSSDNVTIPNVGSYTNALSVTGSQSVNDFTVQANGAYSIAAGGSLTVAGNYTYSSATAATFNCSSTLILSNGFSQNIPAHNYGNLDLTGGNRVLASSGTIGICGTFTRGAGTYTVTGSTINYNGSGAQTIAAGVYNNLSISNARGAATLTSPAGTISVGGTFDISTLGNYAPSVNAASIFDFTSAGSQTIPAFYYGQLNNSGNGARTWASSGIIDVAQGFSPSTLANGNTITGSTIRYSNTSATTWSLTNFTTNVASRNYNNLIFAGGASTVWLPAVGVSIGITGDLSLIGGQLNVGSANGATTLTVDGNIAIGGGTLNTTSSNANTGTINLYGNFAITSGTMTKTGTSTGTINFIKASGTQSVNQTGGTISNATAWNFGNGSTSNAVQLTSGISASTGAFTVYSGATADFQTFVLSGTGSFTAATGATLISANTNATGAIMASGANGSVQTTTRTFSNTDVSYTFNGTSAQVTGTAIGGANIKNLTISNASGVTLSTATTLSATGILNFTAGILDIAAYNLTLTSGATITGYGTGKYVKTNNTGQLRQQVPGAAVVFPVGNAAYNPITLNNSGTSDMLGVVVNNSITQSLNNSNVVVNRSWTITEGTAGGSNLSVVAQWNSPGDEAAGFAAGTTNRMAVWTGSAWAQVGATQAGSNPYTFSSSSNFLPATLTPASYTIAIGKDDAFNCTTPPTISSISITSGYTGDVITLTGTNLISSVNTATIGGTTATISGWTGTTANVTVGAGTTGTITVRSTPVCSATSAATFTYNGYISAQTGNWNTGSTWRGGSVPATLRDVTIDNGHTVTVDAITNPSALIINSGGTLSGTDDSKQVYVGSTGFGSIACNGNLTLGSALVTSGWLVCGTLTVGNGGVFTNNCGNAIAAGAGNVTALTVASGGTYNHNAVGSMPGGNSADFPGSSNVTINSNASVNITKWAQTANPTALPTPAGGQWGNLTINITGQTYSGSWQNSGAIANATTLNIMNTGTRDFRLTTPNSTYTGTFGSINVSGGILALAAGGNFGAGSIVLNVANNLSISGGTATMHGSPVTNEYNTTGVTVNIGGSINMTGGNFYAHANSTTSFAPVNSSTTTLNITGNLSISNATFDLAYFPGPYNYNVSTGPVVLNLKGNLAIGNSGSFRNSNSTTAINTGKTTGTVNLNHASAAQTWTQTGTIQDVIGWNVNGAANTVQLLSNANIGTSTTSALSVASGATMDFQAFVLSGSGSFTGNSGSMLKLGSTAGITLLGTATGNVQTMTARTFNSAGNYIYTGTTNQITGTALPATVTGYVSIANTGANPTDIVTLTNNNTTVSTLNLVTGRFAAGTSQTLRIAAGGVVNGNGYLTNLGNQYIADAAGGTIEFTSNGAVRGTPTLYNVTIGNSGGGVDFTNNATIYNNFQINNLGSVNPNAPKYAVGSILIYNPGGTYNRSIEWGQLTPLAAGYPHHVLVQNSTTVNLGNAVPPNLECGGNLTIGTGASASNIVSLNALTIPLKVLGNLVIGDPATSNNRLALSTAAGGDLELSGNFTRYLTTNYFDYGARKVTFKGTSNATINATVQKFYDLSMQKSGSGDLTLNCAVTIENSGEFITGKINTSAANLLTFEPVATITGTPGSISYINGPAAKMMVAAQSAEFVFPLGKSAGVPVYNPAGVKPVSIASATTFNAEYFVGPNQAQGVMGINLLGMTNLGYWDITNSVTSNNTARVKLYYTNPGNGNWIYYTGAATSPYYTAAVDPCSYCNVAVVHRDAPNTWNFTSGSFNFSSIDPEWRFYGNQGFIYSHTPMTVMTRFSLGYSYNSILPVQLISFTGALQNNNGLLNWQVADSRELAGFELQYSRDGRSFYKLSDIAPDPGNQYNYLHQQLVSGANFYRLKLVEKNGNTGYSNVVLLTFGKLLTQFVGLRENPVRNNLGVVIVSASRQNARAVVGDALGRVVYRTDTQLHSGQNQWNLASHMLAKGIYFIQLQTEDGEKVTLRFMKE